MTQFNQLATGEEKLFAVVGQIDAMPPGGKILCPYCHGETVEGEIFCCDTIMRALNAIADARERFRR